MNHFKKYLAEMIGTLAIVLFGCGSVMVAENLPGTFNPMMIGPVFGIVVAVMIYAVGHISGAHFNPAVTLAFAIRGHFPKKQVPYYWGFQYLGAFLGTFILWYIFPDSTSFGATSFASFLPFKAFIIEFILSFFLMFVIMGVASDARAAGIFAGLAIGAVVALDAIVGGPLTGASMNPARTLFPNLFEAKTAHLWVYFLGPHLGTITAACFYDFIRCDIDSTPDEKSTCC